MLCCFDSKSYAPLDTTTHGGRGGGGGGGGYGMGAYPGQRRTFEPPPKSQSNFVSTGGNALTEHDPNNGTNELVPVTIPLGVVPGQTLHVPTPDGRVIATVVPQGMEPGSTFHVECPPATPGVAQAPAGQQHQQQIPATSNCASQQQQQCLMNVEVPPGIEPGSTIHVRVPGEDRVIAATVPPGVTEFQVAYEPLTSASAGDIKTSQKETTTEETAGLGQSLILVKVPSGTQPGSSIQVQVPGEDRMIAATVPPGVSEFQVAYTPAPGAAQHQ